MRPKIENGMSPLDQSRRSDRAPFTSGLPRLADILRDRWHVSNVANSRHRPNSRYRAAMYYVSVSALETFSPISLATSAACVAIMEWAAPGTVTGEALGMAPHRISALLVM